LWKQDLALGVAWLGQRLGQPVALWGLRLGALLALDYARTASVPVPALILWQPVLSGANYLTQFLRLRIAGALLAADQPAQAGTGALRAALQRGETLEIGGYDLAPELAAALDGLEAAELMAPACPVHWFEAVAAPGATLAPAPARVSADWRQKQVDLQLHVVASPPFWSTQEITVCPAWLAATSALFRGASHGI
jgi:exosortase A-associated hydrolase 2